MDKDYPVLTTGFRWAAAIAIAAVLGACSSSGKSSADAGRRDGGSADRPVTPKDAATNDGSTVASFQGDRRVPLTPAGDVQFVDFFVPHHQAAIDMAGMEADRGSDATVKALAKQIAASQTNELAIMQQARQALTGTAASPPPPADAHMDADMRVMMGASGAQLDKLFLEEMIQHHASALPTAHRAPPALTRADLKGLAGSIYDAQAKEIGEMKMMLGDPSGGAPTAAGGGDGGAADAGFRNADTSPTGDRRVPYTPADDVAFIDFFVGHHQRAIDMANMVIERGARADVKALAQSIKDAQTAEIATMQAARQALTGQANSPAPPPDPHMDADMTAMMALSGTALDTRFLTEMIPHHAAGLPPAHRGRPNLQRPDMRKLALDIFAAQSREIGEMHDMLQQGADGGVKDASPGQ